MKLYRNNDHVLLHFNPTAVPQYIANQHDEHKEITHTASKQQTIALIEAKYTQSLNLKTKIPNFQLTTSIHKIKFYNAYREGEEQLHREEQLQRKETLLHREESSPPLLRAAAFIVAWRHCSLQLRLRR